MAKGIIIEYSGNVNLFCTWYMVYADFSGTYGKGVLGCVFNMKKKLDFCYRFLSSF